MVNQKIAVTPVDNGTEKHENILRVQWGRHGAVPDSPEGWVNQGYVMLVVSQDDEALFESHYVMLDAAEMDFLIRTLKKARKQAFDARLAV